MNFIFQAPCADAEQLKILSMAPSLEGKKGCWDQVVTREVHAAVYSYVGSLWDHSAVITLQGALKSGAMYSRLPLNPYLSVDGLSYGLWGFMGYERALLVQNDNLVPQKSMGYEGLWVMRGMG